MVGAASQMSQMVLVPSDLRREGTCNAVPSPLLVHVRTPVLVHPPGTRSSIAGHMVKQRAKKTGIRKRQSRTSSHVEQAQR
eukprot:6208241-Pleurochrysis_carterae.AAC.1